MTNLIEILDCLEEKHYIDPITYNLSGDYTTIAFTTALDEGLVEYSQRDAFEDCARERYQAVARLYAHNTGQEKAEMWEFELAIGYRLENPLCQAIRAIGGYVQVIERDTDPCDIFLLASLPFDNTLDASLALHKELPGPAIGVELC